MEKKVGDTRKELRGQIEIPWGYALHYRDFEAALTLQYFTFSMIKLPLQCQPNTNNQWSLQTTNNHTF